MFTVCFPLKSTHMLISCNFINMSVMLYNLCVDLFSLILINCYYFILSFFVKIRYWSWCRFRSKVSSCHWQVCHKSWGNYEKVFNIWICWSAPFNYLRQHTPVHVFPARRLNPRGYHSDGQSHASLTITPDVRHEFCTKHNATCLFEIGH